MGRLKQLLPWPPPDGAGTVVAASFDLIVPWCRRILVTMSDEEDAVRGALGYRSFDGIRIRSGGEMFESVRAGLQFIQSEISVDSILIHPVDMPLVSPGTIERMFEALKLTSSDAVIPRSSTGGGHPVLIKRSLADDILAFDGEGGLRQFWATFPSQVQWLDVDDPGVRFDLDRPEDYAEAASMYASWRAACREVSNRKSRLSRD